jgi:transposase
MIMTDFDKDTKNELTPRQRRALPAVIAHPTIEAAAKACGISAQTIRRWLAKSETFKAEIFKAQNQILEEVFRRMAARSHLAAEAIERGVQSADERLACRVALGWLSLARRTRQDVKLDELEKAIEQLKAALAAREGKENEH